MIVHFDRDAVCLTEVFLYFFFFFFGTISCSGVKVKGIIKKKKSSNISHTVYTVSRNFELPRQPCCNASFIPACQIHIPLLFFNVRQI